MRTKIVLVLSSCFFAIDALANGGVWTTDDSMFAVWMVQLLAVVFLLVAAGCFLRERGINAFSKIRDLLRQPILVLTFLCMFVGTSIQYAVSKDRGIENGEMPQIENGELRIENSGTTQSGNLQLPFSHPSRLCLILNSQLSIHIHQSAVQLRHSWNWMADGESAAGGM